MRKIVGIFLVLLAVAGAPLAQLLRVAEVTPAAAEGKTEARQYRLVLAGEFETPAAKATATAKTADGSQRSPKAPDARLLKILDESWESSPRVQFESAEIPVPAILLAPETDEPEQQRETPQFVVLTHSPPSPLARGPPL